MKLSKTLWAYCIGTLECNKLHVVDCKLRFQTRLTLFMTGRGGGPDLLCFFFIFVLKEIGRSSLAPLKPSIFGLLIFPLVLSAKKIVFWLWQRFASIMSWRGRFTQVQTTQLFKNAQLYRCFYYKNQKKSSFYAYPMIFVIFQKTLLILQAFLKPQLNHNEKENICPGLRKLPNTINVFF